MLESLYFFANELKFSFKQGGLLYLLFLYPFFVILVVGFAFNNPPTITVPVGIYSEDPNITASLGAYHSFKVIESPTAYGAESLVREGAVPAAFIITRCSYYYERDWNEDPAELAMNCPSGLFVTMVNDPSRAQIGRAHV